MGDKIYQFLSRLTIRKGERSKNTKISENFQQMTYIFIYYMTNNKVSAHRLFFRTNVIV